VREILGLFLAFVVVLVIVEFAIGLVLFFLVPEGLSSQQIVKQIGGILIGGLFGSVAVVSYHDLRTLKEGAASKAIAQAFE